MADINYAGLFAWNKSKYASESVKGLTEDGKLVVFWDEIPVNQLEEAKDWWKTNRLAVADPEVEYKKFDGTWRTVDVSTDRRANRVVVTLAFGYYETLAWTNARVARITQSQSNSQGAGVSGTTSEEPGRTITVRFPNLNPFKLFTMLAAAPCTDETVTDPVIGTETVTGVWNILVCSPGRNEEDGSGFVDMVLSLDLFTLKAIEDYLGSNRSDVYYVHNVPKPDAQGILNLWGAIKGNSASVSYNADRNTCTLILRDKDMTGVTYANTVTAWACDSQEVTDFWFGVNDPDACKIVNSTNGAHYTNQTAGWSFRRSVRERGDGSWDVSVESRQRLYRAYGTAYGAYATGELIENNAGGTRRRWLQLGLTSQTPRSISAQVDGYSKSQVIRPQDDCSKNVETVEEYFANLSNTAYDSEKTSEYTDSRQDFVHSPTEPILSGSFGSCVKSKDPRSGLWMGTVVTRTYRSGLGGLVTPGDYKTDAVPMREPYSGSDDGYATRYERTYVRHFAASSGSAAATWLMSTTKDHDNQDINPALADAKIVNADKFLACNRVLWKAVKVIRSSTG